jgi:uncharacterized protein (DUF1800 family)
MTPQTTQAPQHVAAREIHDKPALAKQPGAAAAPETLSGSLARDSLPLGSMAALLAACGGGSSSSTDRAAPLGAGSQAAAFSTVEASRLVMQASFGADRAEIDRVASIGAQAWLEEQFTAPTTQSHVDFLRAQGYENFEQRFSNGRLDHSIWRKFFTGTDVLRQRVVYALSQIFVVGLDSIDGYWPDFSVGVYLDQLEANAFGNYRKLLEDVTLSCAMGDYLSMRGSRKADDTGRRPDENYAREVMQLFSIGLVELEADGSTKLLNGSPIETYKLQDVSGLARVFTGWDRGPGFSESVATQVLSPMVNTAEHHESGAKVFLGTTIPENTSATDSLRIALDRLFNHPNVGPFIGRQLIQRLVTSNPSRDYIARVSAAFADNGSGLRGDMKAVIRAVLSDSEARNADTARTNAGFGKLREPVLRFAQWARAAKVTSPSGKWQLGDLSDPAQALGQSPMHSGSVFNFYRPGYVPPNSEIAAASQVAPEFQITTESSVAAYLNFMVGAIQSTDGIYGSDLASDYGAWLPLADDAAALAAEFNLVLAANRLAGDRLTSITNAVSSIPSANDNDRRRRVQVALLLTLASPECLVQK